MPTNPKVSAPRALNWKTDDVLTSVTERPDKATTQRFLSVVLPDMMAEYDSVRLWRKLRYMKSRGVHYSAAFQNISQVWFRDEQNHSKGFMRLCASLLGKSEMQIQAELARGRSNFEKLQKFFMDELGTLVIIAYDEIMTTRSYAEDRGLYACLGEQPLKWFKLVIRDEANHLHNCVWVIKERYGDRLNEVCDLITDLVKIDLAGHTYERTFVMDRRSGNFSPNFVTSAANKLIHLVS